MRTANYLLATVYCLLTALTAHGAEIVILDAEVPDTIEPYKLVKAVAVDKARSNLWEVMTVKVLPDHPYLDFEFPEMVETSANWQSIAFTGRPGRFFVKLVQIHEDNTATQARKIVTITGDDDRPDPPPPPPPGELCIVALFESTDRTGSQVITLLALRDHCDSQKIRCELVDQDQVDGLTEETPEWMAPFLKAAGNKSLPLLLIGSVGDDGVTVVAAEKLPATAREAVELVEKYQ